MSGKFLSIAKTNATILFDAAQSWIDGRVIRLSAGIAYYSLFALVPVLLLAVSFASIFLDREMVNAEVEQAISEVLGSDAANSLLSALDDQRLTSEEAAIQLVSFGILLFAATLLFVAWKEVVDLIWDIPRERGVRASVRRRVFGLLAVLGSGVLLTLVLIAEALVASLGGLISFGAFDLLITITGSILPALIGAVFLAILFKYTPDALVAWRSVWLAAAVTMGMLAVGAWGYGIYLASYGWRSAAGVAGSLFLGLVFVYYAAMILMYGMEIVKEKHILVGLASENQVDGSGASTSV